MVTVVWFFPVVSSALPFAVISLPFAVVGLPFPVLARDRPAFRGGRPAFHGGRHGAPVPATANPPRVASLLLLWASLSSTQGGARWTASRMSGLRSSSPTASSSPS